MDGKITLELKHLCTSFFMANGEIKAVNDVSLKVPEGRIVGIVGESGCGKSMTARSVMGLVKKPGKIKGGEVWLNGELISNLNENKLCRLRGDKMSMIFQEPMTSLNPVMKVGAQVEEVLRLHTDLSGDERKKRTLEIMEKMDISDPERRYNSYPHQLSGGMRQRVMIAMAMVCRPDLLIADEPTTALDVTVQAEILGLMKQLCAEGTSILLISHDLGVIAQVCDYVYVMYAGQILEEADTGTLYEKPMHPYTRGLLGSVKSLRRKGESLDMIRGTVPDLMDMGSGCSFASRCDECSRECMDRMPELIEAEEGHLVRCHQFR